MDSQARARHRRRLLKLSFVLVTCFAAGLIAAAAMAGSGPLSVLSSSDSTVASTDSTTTDPTSTDSSSTTTDSSSTTTDTTSTNTSSTTTDTSPSAPAGPRIIASDQADYAPGSTVTLTGTNWAAGEAVHLFVNDDVGQTWSYNADVTADSNGSFSNQFQLPNWFVATYSAKATGASGDGDRDLRGRQRHQRHRHCH